MARPKKTKDGKERVARFPETTVLKLFVYPGKDGMISSYASRYCVGFEMRRTLYPTETQLEEERKMGMGGDAGPRTFVSQQFLSAWGEDYEAQVRTFEAWRDKLDCVEE